jgi:hypothetical protein
MEIVKFVAWALVNICVPVFGPILLLLLLRFSKSHKDISRGIVFRALKDGALFWTVIAMCAGAMFDLGAALTKGGLTAGVLVVVWGALVWHIFVVAASAVLVLLGTIDAARPPPEVTGAFEDRSMYTASVLTTAITVVTFAASHAAFG